MPYTPKDDAEKGILKSWGELETAVTNHDPGGWSPHFLDEFVLIPSAVPTLSRNQAGFNSSVSQGKAPPLHNSQPVQRFDSSISVTAL